MLAFLKEVKFSFLDAKSKLVTHTRSENRLRVICGKEEGTEVREVDVSTKLLIRIWNILLLSMNLLEI